MIFNLAHSAGVLLLELSLELLVGRAEILDLYDQLGDWLETKCILQAHLRLGDAFIPVPVHLDLFAEVCLVHHQH